MKIVIDPGHGGKDPGAIGPTGLKESVVALAIGQLLRAELTRSGVQVKLTRETDSRVKDGVSDCQERMARVKIADDWKADYFISIHCNSFSDPSAHGTEIWVSALGGQAEKLAYAILPGLVKAQEAYNRGVKPKAFDVLAETDMPAILIENLFIKNPMEEAKLRDPAFQRGTVEAIAKGFLSFVGMKYIPAMSIPDLNKADGDLERLHKDNIKLREDLHRLAQENANLRTSCADFRNRIRQISQMCGEDV